MTDHAQPHAIITGATSGIGFHAARALAAKGFRLTLGARVLDSGNAAAGRILGEVPGADVTVKQLDLASLDSVAQFAGQLIDDGRGWDVFLANASAQVVPFRTLTEDGFEWNFGVNYLAHFALTGRIMPLAAPEARVISTTSLTYHSATLKFYDLRWDNGYRPGRAYAMSKLAILVAARELARRIDTGQDPAIPATLRSIVVHPGFIQDRPRSTAPVAVAEKIMGQTAEQGADPAIMAATENVANGSFIGPSGPGQLRGAPRVIADPEIPDELRTAERLWRLSCQLAKFSW